MGGGKGVRLAAAPSAQTRPRQAGHFGMISVLAEVRDRWDSREIRAVSVWRSVHKSKLKQSWWNELSSSPRKFKAAETDRQRKGETERKIYIDEAHQNASQTSNWMRMRQLAGLLFIYHHSSPLAQLIVSDNSGSGYRVLKGGLGGRAALHLVWHERRRQHFQVLCRREKKEPQRNLQLFALWQMVACHSKRWAWQIRQRGAEGRGCCFGYSWHPLKLSKSTLH